MVIVVGFYNDLFVCINLVFELIGKYWRVIIIKWLIRMIFGSIFENMCKVKKLIDMRKKEKILVIKNNYFFKCVLK